MPRTSLDSQRQILSCWWLLEMFNPQPMPKTTPLATRPENLQVIEWTPRTPLPWKSLPAPDKKDFVWRHEVYLGMYRLEETYEWLHKAFHDDNDAYDPRPPGCSACAGMVVDQDGRLVPGSAVLSSALWAVGRIANQVRSGERIIITLDWMEKFAASQERLCKEFDTLEGGRRQAAGTREPPAQDPGSLADLLHTAQRVCEISELPDLATNRILIKSVRVSARNEQELEFLNSLFLDDLGRVWRAIIDGAIPGSALEAYLTRSSDIRKADRVDVMARPEVVTKGAGIDRLPLGRWLTNPAHCLALSQQFAVNQALDDLATTRGLMGVNGPPGTGKTTMLRDLLAGNVVERAGRLARLTHPGQAFTGTEHRWQNPNGWNCSVPQLRPELTGFEMVVASANNAAVENVTNEIPARNANVISDPWITRADYFAEIATCVLRGATPVEPEGDDMPGSPAPAEAWGLVAARLGNKRNRNGFRSEFWFDKMIADTKERDPETPKRMQTRLKEWATGTAPVRSWKQAREDYRRAEQRVRDLMEERRLAAERLSALPAEEERQRELQTRVRELEENRNAVGAELQELLQHVSRVEEEVRDAAARREREMGSKPGILEVIFTLGRAIREWRTRFRAVADQLDEVEKRHRDIRTREQRLREHLAGIGREHVVCANQLNQVTDHLVELRAECVRDSSRFGAGYPGRDWVGDQREMRAPWLDPELDEARSDLFLAALQLHEDFLANTAQQMRDWLGAAVDVVGGQQPRKLEPEKLLAAWQLFFLVVPLVSTTFASFGRMFGNLEAESLGWVLIDEAGQACPQQAAGAIWRARRTVVVGDPLQLPPVVTIPKKVQLDIAASCDVSADWLAPQVSVQSLADRVGRFGTTLSQGDRDMWVSAPLKVHRRCDDPMFSLCNQIAYNGIMVNGVHRGAGESMWSDIPYSRWLDEPANINETHLQPNQIRRLQQVLEDLERRGIPYSDMIAISPFREVANALDSLKRQYGRLRAGTIHTAQGREADVVFLVLGGAPDRPGAKAWAAQTVNLVNVAASRAKRRLYVIGDRAEWAKYNYFQQLSAVLD
ncbi:AAA domain-containing protein [[Pseudopropionibacterium] massiliense]|uniref:AAA domain-containing protein n=1 Tax=[Pseudopropionibacterium] massiliense TaxID=2220000 RepID=UPI001030AFF9|nr:AAA domain-containing protein [[Pseudopropionibacterium] massiliense]